MGLPFQFICKIINKKAETKVMSSPFKEHVNHILLDLISAMPRGESSSQKENEHHETRTIKHYLP